MSVIFGIEESDVIILCGDKRSSTKEGAFIDDNMQKVTVINEHLAFAAAGNAAIEKAVTIDSEKIGMGGLNVDSFLKVITDFYARIESLQLGVIAAMPFCAIIAGKGSDGTSKLISLSYMHGKLSYNTVPMALYPPFDVSMEDCAQIFVRNYKLNRPNFCEKTAAEISALSKVVSPTGHKWEFHKKTGRGILTEF